VPSEKRARQRAAREARLAAEAKAAKRRRQLRNGGIVVLVGGAVIGLIFAFSGNTPKKPHLSVSTTTTTKAGATTTTAAGHPGTTTTTPASTTTTVATAASNARAQQAANSLAVKAGCPASTKTAVNTQKYPSAPAMTIDPNKLYSATVSTTAGTFVMALNAKTAPITVNNFVFLAQKGYYHCVIFHRVIPGFMDQTGDPTGTGSGGPGYTIKDENPAKVASGPQYPIGSVAMANTGSPNSGGSQFFIVTGSQGEGLPNTYALFARVISGLDVVNTINGQGSAQGVPPDVTQRILSVTINESAGL
jgi:cyclophilin family peptidyl-prolyl cis-trans isomerase